MSSPPLQPAAFTISVVIIAQDEEAVIERAVRSCLPFADEVVVIDGGSKDATVARAEAAGARIVHNPWPGYAKQRNAGAEAATHDWVFMLDADEAVGETLAASFIELRQTSPEYGAFYVTRVADFFGRWMWTRADRHIRLYDKTRFSIRDVLVHEAPDVGDAPVGELDGLLWHYGFRDVENLVKRFNHYTTLDAAKAYESGRRFKVSRFLLRPPLRVAHTYLLRGMWRQGMSGAGVTVMWLLYELLKELKLYELGWQAKGSPHEPADEPATPIRVKKKVRVDDAA